MDIFQTKLRAFHQNISGSDPGAGPRPANGPGTSSQDKAKTSAHIEAVTDKDSVFQNLPPQPSFPKTLDFEASARTPSILSKKSSSAPPFVRLPPLPLHSGDDSGSRVDDDA